jgi:hypothetical protein
LEDHNDAYSHATSVKASDETFLTVYNNYLQDTDDIAWMEAESAVANSYRNNSTQSTAKVNAHDAIDSYYAVKEHNLYEQWNNTISAFQNVKKQADSKNLTDPNGAEIYYFNANINNSKANDEWSVVSIEVTDWGVRNVTKVDGTVHPVQSMRVRVQIESSAGSEATNQWITPRKGTHWVTTGSGDDVGVRFDQISIRPPDTSMQDFVWVWMPDYRSPVETIDEQNQEVTDDISNFVDGTYGAFENGTIDAADVLSRTTQMRKFMTEGENGAFDDTVVALSSMGLESPYLNGTGVMTVEFEDSQGVARNGTGMLLSSSTPANESGWSVGDTYWTNETSGVVMFASETGEQYTLNETSEYRIVSAVSENGEEIQNVTTTEIVYQESNTTRYLELLNQSLELYEDLAEKQSGGGGGTVEAEFSWPWSNSDPFDGGSVITGGVIIAVASGAVVLIVLRG